LNSSDHVQLADADTVADPHSDLCVDDIVSTGPLDGMSPAHLETAALMYGVALAPAATARILVIGCGTGWDVLAFASAHPGAQVAGLDFRADAITQAQANAAALGLHNATFYLADVSALEPETGEFDYILAPALYGKVDSEQSTALTRACRENLGPNGIAVLGYDTYPGCKAGDIVRDAMLLHGRSASSSEELVQSARAALALFSEGMAPEHPYAQAIGAVVSGVKGQSDDTLARNYLMGEGVACYFVDFADQMQNAGLAYVGDAEPHKELPAAFGNHVSLTNSLLALGQSKIIRQQYLDFSIGRSHRKSMLVHVERAADIRTSPDLSCLRSLRLAAALKRTPGQYVNSTAAFFQTPDGREFEATDAMVERASDVFAQVWPHSLSFDELAALLPTNNARPRDPAHAAAVAAAVERLFRLGVMQVRAQAGLADESDAAALQLVPGLPAALRATGDTAERLAWFNIYQQNVSVLLTDARRFVLQHIDGTQTFEAQCAALVAAVKRGNIASIRADGDVQRIARAVVVRLVEDLRHAGLILGGSAAWVSHYRAVLETIAAGDTDWLPFLDCLYWHARRVEGQVTPVSRAAGIKRTAQIVPERDRVEFSRLVRLRALDEAIAMARQWTIQHPKSELVWRMYARALEEAGMLPPALDAIARALALAPTSTEVHALCGALFIRAKRKGDADRAHWRCLLGDPDHVVGLTNLAQRLWKQGRHDDARGYFERSIEKNPTSATTISNYGNLLMEQGRLNHAESMFRRALALQPDLFPALSNLLFCLSHRDDVAPEALYREHVRYGELAKKTVGTAPIGPGARSKTAGRKLRIGFVSGDLREHPVANFFVPIWEGLDRARFEVCAYNTSDDEDFITGRMRRGAAIWREVASLGDAALAALIRSDEIDVLFDLSGHTAGTRLTMFAHKPAPVQVSWIGYPGTTGVSAMDYYFMDKHAVPLGDVASQFVEKLVYLPSLSAFKPFERSPEISPAPVLANGFVTFGSFNRTSKISDQTLAVWRDVLNAVPNAKMLIGDIRSNENRDELIARFTAQGIDAGRLIFKKRTGMEDYLRAHNEVDIALDTYPYTGGTTTNHSLWMGVPVLTLKGVTRVSAQTAGVLGRNGLADWVCDAPEQIVSKAVHWASHPGELAALRAQMRAQLRATPGRQDDAVLRGLESAITQMWQRWCKDLPAASFVVEAST
jgi:tetratricopeptide (TPR) repeat protein